MMKTFFKNKIQCLFNLFLAYVSGAGEWFPVIMKFLVRY